MSNMAQPIGLNLKPEEMNDNLRRHLEVVQWARMEIVRRKGLQEKEVKPIENPH